MYSDILLLMVWNTCDFIQYQDLAVFLDSGENVCDADDSARLWAQTHPFVDGEYGADGRQAVDVTGAVQRVEADHILPLWRNTLNNEIWR